MWWKKEGINAQWSSYKNKDIKNQNNIFSESKKWPNLEQEVI